MCLLILAIGIPLAFYLLLSTEWAQERLRSTGEDALRKLLGTEVTIDRVGFSPFARIRVDGVRVADDNGNPAARIDALEGRLEVADLIRSGKIIIDYVYIEGMKASLWRDSVGAPLNIEGIIKRLSKKDDTKPAASIELRINNVELSDCAVSYEVLDSPATPGRFNPAHIRLSGIDAEVYAPHVGADSCQVRLVGLRAKDASGLEVDDVTAELSLSPSELSLTGVSVALPNSLVKLDDITLPIAGLPSLSGLGKTIPVEVGISDGSTVYLPDLAPFLPRLADIDNTLRVEMRASGTLDSIQLQKLSVVDAHESNRISLSGTVTGLPAIDSVRIGRANAMVILRNGAAARILERAGVKMSRSLATALAAATNPVLSAKYDGSLSDGAYEMQLRSDGGEMASGGTVRRLGRRYALRGNISVNDADLGALLGNADLGTATVAVAVDGSLDPGSAIESMRGMAEAKIEALGYRGYRYAGINVVAHRESEYSAVDVRSTDPNCRFRLNANYNHPADGEKNADWLCNIERFNPDTLRLYRRFPGHTLSAMIRGKLHGTSLGKMAGEVQVNNLKYLDARYDGLNVRRFLVNIDNETSPGRIDVASDFLQGSVRGDFDLGTVAESVSTIMSEVFPSYAQFYRVGRYDEEGNAKHFGNDFKYAFTLQDADNVMGFFGMPVQVMDPVEITGMVSDSLRVATLAVDAPWLLQGNNLIQKTKLSLTLDGAAAECSLMATTHYPTKKGPMDVEAKVTAIDDRLDTDIDWAIQREQPINGQINFVTSIRKSTEGKLLVETDINPGQINFGSEVWSIHNAHIVYSDKYLSVDNLALQAADQMVHISGVATDMPHPALTVDLKNVRLIDIFETLDINKALISGLATGRLEVSQLFSGKPDIHSDRFFVKDMGYNYTTIGDGDIKIKFDNDRGAFCFDAVLDRKSVV